jgi:catalase
MASKTRKGANARAKTGNGGETHQNAGGPEQWLTTNQGTPISDNQNSLKSGERGPSLLEDFILREKITHFDHERIPERIVHARGSGAHGYFQPTKSLAKLTKAAFLQDPRSSYASPPSPAAPARSTCRATCAASPSSSIPRKATSIWSATTSRCSSSRMLSSFPTSSTP